MHASPISVIGCSPQMTMVAHASDIAVPQTLPNPCTTECECYLQSATLGARLLFTGKHEIGVTFLWQIVLCVQIVNFTLDIVMHTVEAVIA